MRREFRPGRPDRPTCQPALPAAPGRAAPARGVPADACFTRTRSRIYDQKRRRRRGSPLNRGCRQRSLSSAGQEAACPMFDRDLGTAAIAARSAASRSCCPVPRAAREDGPDTRLLAGLAPLPPPCNLEAAARADSRLAAHRPAGYDRPRRCARRRRDWPPRRPSPPARWRGFPAAARQGARRVHAYPHTAPALFTADVPATLASRNRTGVMAK